MKVDSLNYSMKIEDICAYVITMAGNDVSQRLSGRAQNSCKKIEQPYQVWDAFIAEEDGSITYPQHAESQHHYKWLKLMNTFLKPGEIAAVLSHYSLWCHCIEIDRPIIVLEHDAVMVKPYNIHPAYNVINYLGGMEQYREGKIHVFPIHSAATDNYRFICRAHAYAIDPASARQLVAHLVRFGICAPADMLMRMDIFSIIQTDFHAFDIPGETTIKDRDPNWQSDAAEILANFP